MKPGQTRCSKRYEGRQCMMPKGHDRRCCGYYLVGHERYDWWVNELGEYCTDR